MEKFTNPRDWADMRLFQAIAEQGSLSAAAEHLGLTQPSVGRRLNELEARLDVLLFVRGTRRMDLTDVGRAILDNVRAMEREMRAIERTVDVQSHAVAGPVCVTATEGIGSEWLAPELLPFAQKYPDIQLHITVENRVVNLVQREADIALRLNRPTEPELIGRKLVDVGLGIYASPNYLQRFKPITDLQQILDDHQMVSLDMVGTSSTPQEVSRHLLPLFGRLPELKPALTTNSPTAQMAATRAGFGLAVMAHRWARMFPDLVQVLPGQTVGSLELWLVTHEELRHSARIRAVVDYLSERFTAHRSLYEHGEGDLPGDVMINPTPTAGYGSLGGASR